MNDIDEDFEDEESDEVDSSRNPELEKAFQKAYDKALPLINKQLQLANDALVKAQDIADKYGVAFYSDISPLSQGFVSSELREKFEDLSDEFIGDVTGVYDPYGNGLEPGWQHSSVC